MTGSCKEDLQLIIDLFDERGVLWGDDKSHKLGLIPF